jgi:hypothetical protein
LKDAESGIASTMKNLDTYCQKRREAMEMIGNKDSLIKKFKIAAESQEKEIDKLIGKMYESVRYDQKNKEIIALTSPISIEDGGNSYDLGNYTIRISLPQKTFYFSTNKGRVVNMYDHPHIKESYPCFGEISHEVVKLLNDGQISILLQVLYQYLNSYNASDAYCHLVNFVKEAWDNSNFSLQRPDDEDEED